MHGMFAFYAPIMSAYSVSRQVDLPINMNHMLGEALGVDMNMGEAFAYHTCPRCGRRIPGGLVWLAKCILSVASGVVENRTALGHHKSVYVRKGCRSVEGRRGRGRAIREPIWLRGFSGTPALSL